MAKQRMDEETKGAFKRFGEKVGMVATASSFPGIAAGQALADNVGLRAAGSVLKPLADVAMHHPYGAGIAGGLATAAAGATAAIIHQRGIAVGRRQHLHDAANNARR